MSPNQTIAVVMLATNVLINTWPKVRIGLLGGLARRDEGHEGWWPSKGACRIDAMQPGVARLREIDRWDSRFAGRPWRWGDAWCC